MTYYTILESPVGKLLISSDETHLTRLFMEDHVGGPTANSDFANSPETTVFGREGKFGNIPHADWQRDDKHPPLAQARQQLSEYFAGKRTDFDLPLKPAGSGFQLEVWNQLTKIPFGQTITYGELAKRIGKPDAPRAVGLANGSNPISLIIPCHRVIGASGKLTGYGGGLDRKVWLLEHEGAMPSGRQPELAMS